MREKIPYKQRLNQHGNSNSRTTRLQKISGKKRWRASKRPRNANSDGGELLQNVVSQEVQNHWSTFWERKQRLTAKLNSRSYVQNNRNRKVNSK